VNKSKRATGAWLLALSLAAFLISGCIFDQIATGKGKKTTKPAEVPNPIKPGHVDSRIFPALGVSGDSCYVYLKPTRRSEYFGPLKKGEKIHRLDTRGQWFRVWIPRLRTSGWVSKTRVFKIKQKISSPGGVPLDVLNTVTVISSRANIRSTPSTRGPKIHLAKRKQQFFVFAAKDGWYQIWVPHLKKKGWIYGKIVTYSPQK
jgi:uncharacterized protein YgiM (DUF1202 family)